MNLGLENRGVVVTGGSRGIGKAIAVGFAREGSNLAICARGEADLIATQRELEEHAVRIYAEQCDVGDKEALESFLDDSRASLGEIVVLVNNVSAAALRDVEADWQAGLNVDVMAAVRATMKVIPWMKAAGGGCIVNISSISGFEASSPPYGAVKAALISLTKSHAIAFAKDGIRVNAVAPGSICFEGGFWDRVRRERPDAYESVVDSIPWGRMGTPEEVADAVVFLSSERASWITGSCLTVDGGQHHGIP
jgi:3-oxoacyl-[acyl-carrier protein] reductase